MAKRLKTITAGRLVTACLYTIPKYSKSDSPYLRREKAKVSGAGRTQINNCDTRNFELPPNFRA